MERGVKGDGRGWVVKAGKGGKDGLAGWKAGRIGSCEAGDAMGWWAGGQVG